MGKLNYISDIPNAIKGLQNQLDTINKRQTTIIKLLHNESVERNSENSEGIFDIADLADENSTSILDLADMLAELDERVTKIEERM